MLTVPVKVKSTMTKFKAKASKIMFYKEPTINSTLLTEQQKRNNQFANQVSYKLSKERLAF